MTDISLNSSKEGILLSFAWMTSNNHYSLKAVKKIKGDESTLLALFNLLEVLSKTPWTELSKLTKYDTDKGGFEELPLQALKPGILDEVPEEFVKKILSVLVFRFNKGEDRLIAYKEGNALYLLGFDLHFKLYDHGS